MYGPSPGAMEFYFGLCELALAGRLISVLNLDQVVNSLITYYNIREALAYFVGAKYRQLRYATADTKYLFMVSIGSLCHLKRY